MEIKSGTPYGKYFREVQRIQNYLGRLIEQNDKLSEANRKLRNEIATTENREAARERILEELQKKLEETKKQVRDQDLPKSQEKQASV